MLEPEGRQLLLDALRPPAGYTFDQAIGTTYTLDLVSLLAAPLGFALFDREVEDGRIVADPIALLEAVRRFADRITIFCQAGEIAIPREYRTILAYLEGSVVEVVPPVEEAIFHPKVWAIRYVAHEGGGVRYRVLCLSRNLTFDRAWDTILRVEGDVGDEVTADDGLASFLRSLPPLAVRPVSPAVVDRSRALADEVQRVRFRPPDGFDSLRFWPMGLGEMRDPLKGRIDRLLVVSPFLTGGQVQGLARLGRRNILISRPETLDLVGGTSVAGFAETLVLSPTAIASLGEEASEDAARGPVDEAAAERPAAQLRGLHAKLFVADVPHRGKVWTGSANATDAGFGANVEFLVELEGRKAICGVEAFVGDEKGKLGLRKLLEPYVPQTLEPRELTTIEKLERRLEFIRRRLAALAYIATVSDLGDDTFRIELVVRSAKRSRSWNWDALTGGARVSYRPLTLLPGFATEAADAQRQRTATFSKVSFGNITPFFVVDIEVTEGRDRATATFVVIAELIGAPADRRERTLVALLENRNELLRFLLLLLGQVGSDDLGKAFDLEEGREMKGDGRWLVAQWKSLLEPLLRTLASEPSRLDEIDRLLTDLDASDAGRKLLPPGWREIWGPVWEARQKVS